MADIRINVQTDRSEKVVLEVDLNVVDIIYRFLGFGSVRVACAAGWWGTVGGGGVTGDGDVADLEGAEEGSYCVWNPKNGIEPLKL